MAVQTRRRVVASLALAALPPLVRIFPTRAAEPGPETTRIRLVKQNGVCTAPALIADELLRAEGFRDIESVPLPSSAEVSATVGSGRADFGLHFSASIITALDAGLPLTVIAGIHVGCFELIGNDQVRGITDLKGRAVGVPGLGSSPHVYLSAMAANVGLEPARDIHWITSADPRPIDLFAQGKIDAFLGFPPEPKEAEAQHLGHLIVNSALDHPWSQYFCCMMVGNRDFVRGHPVATKHALRAIIKAAELCASNPAEVVQRIVAGGYTPRYDYAFATVRELDYGQWRVYDPEDTMRFYALRLREAGMIKATPQQIIAEGTDWRFANELKRELKA